MRGVKPALMSRRCRTWSWPSMLTSIFPAIPGWWLSWGPSKAAEQLGVAADRLDVLVLRQHPEPVVVVARKPSGNACHLTGASWRKAVKTSWGNPSP